MAYRTDTGIEDNLLAQAERLLAQGQHGACDAEWKRRVRDYFSQHERGELMKRQREAKDALVSEVGELRLLLDDVADKLDTWAAESVRGGWSTHQVRPMRDLAFDIRVKIGVGVRGGASSRCGRCGDVKLLASAAAHPHRAGEFCDDCAADEKHERTREKEART